eukprot:TRINITY_DN13238_c0_g1_i2.p1 TRINITY_DN13238_c0_g1~~TRINITY_DN13238_c0_g1_i2.p1  ORF type:complete len:422 (+),score=175.27 TRINITY_DN13238_c0_g1_i2:65-1267(+)
MRRFVASRLLRGPLALQSRFASSKIPTAANPSGKYEDKLLFTPGPLTTSWSVKEAMMHDMGSRDAKFINVINEVRSGLLRVAGVDASEFTSIPMQGSGTYGVEATLTSVVPRDGKVLVIANGAYGDRIKKMCQVSHIAHKALSYHEDSLPSLQEVERVLSSDTGITHVAVVHSETTSGIINPIEQIGKIVHKYRRSFFVDAMSSFGAVPIDMQNAHIDYLVSSANKCIEGVPGFSFAIARKSALAASEGNARSLSLDIHGQVKGLDANGQFRFTPPTHALLAFHQALAELDMEGGVAGRARRYQANRDLVVSAMERLGYVSYLPAPLRGYIISSFKYPISKNWNFNTFYSKLSDRGFLIYPGKVTNADCFRIGHIGRIFESDTQNMIKALEDVTREMKIF